jgi:hypothetical protein
MGKWRVASEADGGTRRKELKQHTHDRVSLMNVHIILNYEQQVIGNG